jgi:hypothetical protein
MPKEIERRFLTVEMRAVEGDEMIVEGYPIVYEQDTDLGWFRERIARGAAKNALAKSDEFLLFNHDPNQPLARRKNGTLSASEDDKGVFIRADLSKSERGPGLYRDIKNGLIDKMSFAFTVASQTWQDPTGDGENELRIINEIEELFDYSPVTYPAYKQTELVARSAEHIAQEHAESTTVEEAPSTEEVLSDPLEALEPYELEANQLIGEI